MKPTYSKNYLFGDLISNLPFKPEGVITAKGLAIRMACSEGYIRRMINQARSFGIPICSTRHGYYFSNDPKEIELTIGSLKRRISTQIAAIIGLSELIEGGLRMSNPASRDLASLLMKEGKNPKIYQLSDQQARIEKMNNF